MRHTCIIRKFLVDTPCQQLCACVHSREKTEYILSERSLVKNYGFALSGKFGRGGGGGDCSLHRGKTRRSSVHVTAAFHGFTFTKFDLVYHLLYMTQGTKCAQ